MLPLIETKSLRYIRYILFLLVLCTSLGDARATLSPGLHFVASAAMHADGSPAEAEVGGTVNDPSGAVVGGATITVRNAAGTGKTAVTDASGLFQITGLSPGKYQLSVTAQGFAELADEVNISADDPSVLLSIVLYPQVRGLPGKVTDTSGAAVVGATVRVRNAAGESKSAVTDKDGKFQIEGLTPDKYSVLVTAKGYTGYMAAGLSVRPGEPAAPLAIVLFSRPSAGSAPAKAEQAPAAPAIAAAPAEPAPAAAPVETPQPQVPAAPAAPLVTLAPLQKGETAIVGTVTDTSAALIPGATVTIRNAAGESKTTATDAEGKFQVPGLAAGSYDVSVTAPGFSETKTPGVNVPAKEIVSVAVQLTVATTATQVNVQAQRAAQVETLTAEVSGTISRNEIVSLGLNGRNFSQLIALAPGVSNQTSQDEAKVGVVGSAKYSVNGGRVEYNTFEVDGNDVLNTDIAASHGHATLIIYPSLDAIQEMKVLTSNYGAMYGRTASGTVQVAIKSGGPQLHGVAYEFIRNEDFDARNFFDPPGRIPLYRRNDFGGALGGPLYIPGLFNVKKDKTFFFLSEEFRREKSPSDFNQGVPSDAERGFDPDTQTYGDIADFSDACPPWPTSTFSLTQYPDCPSLGSTTSPREPFKHNQFFIDPAAQAILQTGLIPRANSTLGCNSSIQSCYVAAVSLPMSWREELARLDHNLTSGTKIFLRGIHDHWDTTTGVPQWGNVTNSFPSVLNNFQGPGLNVTANVTSVLSPTSVNTFSIGYTRQDITLADVAGPGVSFSRAGLNSLQYPMGNIFDNGNGNKLPGIVIGGTNSAYGGNGFAVDTSYMPWEHVLEKATYRDDVSKIIGKHTVQAGIQYIRAERTELSAVNGANSGNVQGLMTFSNQGSYYTTGNAFADFLYNAEFPPFVLNTHEDMRYYQQDNVQASYRLKYWDAEPYVQDDWRVTSRLTVNLGLRLSLFGNWEPVNETLYNWVPGAYDPNVWSASGLQVNYSQGYLQSGSYGLPLLQDLNNLNPVLTNGLVECGAQGVPASCQSSHVINPAPRVGFAWDPRGDGKTSIRGGYGFFYEHGTGSEANAGSLMGNPPQVLSMTEEYPTNFTSIGVSRGVQTEYPLNLMSIPSKNLWPYVQQWSFGVQRELAADTLVTLAYVGSKGTHLATAMQLNQLPPVPNGQNPFGPTEPFTADICHAQQINSQNPFDPQGYFYFNGSNLYYGSPGAASNAVVLAMIAACNGTQATPGYGSISFDLNVLRPYHGLGQINSIQDAGSSIYHSLQFTIRHHRGPLEVAASYTYGHSLDTSSDRYESTFVDSYDLRANRASSDFDQRHMLNLSYFYKLPLLEMGKAVNKFLGGDESKEPGNSGILFRNWVLSGITVYQSGNPFSVVNGASASGISVLDNAGLALGLGADSYPDLAPPGTTCSTAGGASGTFGPVLDDRCRFVAPRGLTQGSAGRNSMYNPGRTNFDWAFLRDFKVWGERTLQFRAEAFNIFNTTQFRIYDPVKGNTASNTISCYGQWDSLYTVGVSYSAGAPSCNAGNGFLRPVDAHRARTLQFGMKFNF